MATKFQRRELVIDSDTQARLLGLCNIDPAIYGDEVDPSAFTALAILEAIRCGMELPGLHAGQTLTMHRPISLGEFFWLTGEVSDRTQVDRGEMLSCCVELRDRNGTLVLESTERLLIPTSTTTRRASSSTTADHVAQFREEGEVVFQPEQVVTYQGRDVNPIHFDPDAASRAGFRAPIIGGEVGVRHVMAMIWKAFKPARLSVRISFLRPIFWDDRCTLMVEESQGAWKSACLGKSGKKAIELAIENLSVRAER